MARKKRPAGRRGARGGGAGGGAGGGGRGDKGGGRRRGGGGAQAQVQAHARKAEKEKEKEKEKERDKASGRDSADNGRDRDAAKAEAAPVPATATRRLSVPVAAVQPQQSARPVARTAKPAAKPVARTGRVSLARVTSSSGKIPLRRGSSTTLPASASVSSTAAPGSASTVRVLSGTGARRPPIVTPGSAGVSAKQTKTTITLRKRSATTPASASVRTTTPASADALSTPAPAVASAHPSAKPVVMGLRSANRSTAQPKPPPAAKSDMPTGASGKSSHQPPRPQLQGGHGCQSGMHKTDGVVGQRRTAVQSPVVDVVSSSSDQGGEDEEEEEGEDADEEDVNDSAADDADDDLEEVASEVDSEVASESVPPDSSVLLSSRLLGVQEAGEQREEVAGRIADETEEAEEEDDNDNDDDDVASRDAGNDTDSPVEDTSEDEEDDDNDNDVETDNKSVAESDVSYGSTDVARRPSQPDPFALAADAEENEGEDADEDISWVRDGNPATEEEAVKGEAQTHHVEEDKDEQDQPACTASVIVPAAQESTYVETSTTALPPASARRLPQPQPQPQLQPQSRPRPRKKRSYLEYTGSCFGLVPATARTDAEAGTAVAHAAPAPREPAPAITTTQVSSWCLSDGIPQFGKVHNHSYMTATSPPRATAVTAAAAAAAATATSAAIASDTNTNSIAFHDNNDRHDDEDKNHTHDEDGEATDTMRRLRESLSTARALSRPRHRPQTAHSDRDQSALPGDDADNDAWWKMYLEDDSGQRTAVGRARKRARLVVPVALSARSMSMSTVTQEMQVDDAPSRVLASVRVSKSAWSDETPQAVSAGPQTTNEKAPRSEEFEALLQHRRQLLRKIQERERRRAPETDGNRPTTPAAHAGAAEEEEEEEENPRLSTAVRETRAHLTQLLQTSVHEEQAATEELEKRFVDALVRPGSAASSRGGSK